MECPHCGAETLMGATTCISCGRPMFERSGSDRRPAPEASVVTPDPFAPPPAPVDSDSGRAPDSWPGDVPDDPFCAPTQPMAADGDAPAMPPPVELPARRKQSLCTVCMGPCTDPLARICDACNARAANAAFSQSGEMVFGQKMGTSAFRPPPVRKKRTAGVRALAAAFWGGLLVLAGLGVVNYVRPPDAGAVLTEETRADAVEVEFAMPQDAVLRYRTTLDLRIHREETPNSFDDSLMTIFDLEQTSVHDAEVMLASDDGPTALLEVRTECHLESQRGVWQKRDGSREQTYPWPGRIEVVTVRARPDRPLAAGGGSPLPARDVPPFLTFGDTSPPSDTLRPGARWTTEALLPCLATPGGAITPTRFDCTLRYVGRRVLQGKACAVIRLEATPLRDLDERFERLDGVGGRVTGALAFDVASGLLVEARLAVDAHARRGGRRPEERVSVIGDILVTRE